MRTFPSTTPAAALAAFFAFGCSSSSSGGPTSPGDAGSDAITDSRSGIDTTTSGDTTSDDTNVDETTTYDSPGIDTTPPPNKCTGVTCSGSYQKCCASTGACYDTRYATCY